jgi:hypothetical protein
MVRPQLLYGTTYSDYAKFWSAPPLFLEDENIFPKIGHVGSNSIAITPRTNVAKF